MHEPDRIDGMEHKASHGPDVLGFEQIVIAAIGVRDATAARSHAVEPAFIEGLKKHQDRPWPRHLLRIDQLLPAAELAGGDEVLHTRDHHAG